MWVWPQNLHDGSCSVPSTLALFMHKCVQVQTQSKWKDVKFLRKDLFCVWFSCAVSRHRTRFWCPRGPCGWNVQCCLVCGTRLLRSYAVWHSTWVGVERLDPSFKSVTCLFELWAPIFITVPKIIWIGPEHNRYLILSNKCTSEKENICKPTFISYYDIKNSESCFQ